MSQASAVPYWNLCILSIHDFSSTKISWELYICVYQQSLHKEMGNFTHKWNKRKLQLTRRVAKNLLILQHPMARNDEGEEPLSYISHSNEHNKKKPKQAKHNDSHL
jgi:hypothetical protein